MKQQHKNFKRVVKRLQPAIDTMIAELLAGPAPEPVLPNLGNPFHAVVVDSKRGLSYCRHGSMSVPLWAYERGEDYFKYYVAHELSHLISRSRLHDEAFYKAFKRLCPKRLWHYEETAFPRAWQRFGQSA